jgi:hypothetical protein
MKLLKKRTGSGESRTVDPCAQGSNNRTETVRPFLFGCHESKNSPISMRQDLLLAIEFGQAILESAVLMSERLVRLENNPSTLLLREKLETAQARFTALKSRASSYPEQAVT